MLRVVHSAVVVISRRLFPFTFLLLVMVIVLISSVCVAVVPIIVVASSIYVIIRLGVASIVGVVAISAVSSVSSVSSEASLMVTMAVVLISIVVVAIVVAPLIVVFSFGSVAKGLVGGLSAPVFSDILLLALIDRSTYTVKKIIVVVFFVLELILGDKLIFLDGVQLFDHFIKVKCLAVIQQLYVVVVDLFPGSFLHRHGSVHVTALCFVSLGIAHLTIFPLCRNVNAATTIIIVFGFDIFNGVFGLVGPLLLGFGVLSGRCAFIGIEFLDLGRVKNYEVINHVQRSNEAISLPVLGPEGSDIFQSDGLFHLIDVVHGSFVSDVIRDYN